MAKLSKFKKGDNVKCLMHNDTGIYKIYEVLRNELIVGYDYEDHNGKVSMRWQVKKSLFKLYK